VEIFVHHGNQYFVKEWVALTRNLNPRAEAKIVVRSAPVEVLAQNAYPPLCFHSRIGRISPLSPWLYNGVALPWLLGGTTILLANTVL
jgi:hypothetical protein